MTDPTPGDILRHEFMTPLGLSMTALAIVLRVPLSRIHGIVRGTRGITPDTALRLSRYFGTSAQFWLNLQMQYDLRRACDGSKIDQEITPYDGEWARSDTPRG